MKIFQQVVDVSSHLVDGESSQSETSERRIVDQRHQVKILNENYFTSMQIDANKGLTSVESRSKFVSKSEFIRKTCFWVSKNLICWKNLNISSNGELFSWKHLLQESIFLGKETISLKKNFWFFLQLRKSRSARRSTSITAGMSERAQSPAKTKTQGIFHHLV